MKRPLFFVALAYALGEVIGICTRTMEQAGIAFVMLVCVGIYLIGYRKWKSAWVVLTGMIVGMLSAFFRVPEPLKSSAVSVVSREENYQILSYKKAALMQETCSVAGLVVGMDGTSYIIRIMESSRADIRGRILLRGDLESDIEISDMVLVSGMYQAFQKESNPGGFSQMAYYYARGIHGYFYQPKIHKLYLKTSGIQVLYGGKKALYTARERLDVQLCRILPADTAAVFSGILLGDKTEIAPETKKLYQIGGIAHILAISGLHISLIGTGIFRLLRKLRLPYLPAGLLAIGSVWIYGIFTGMSLATIRAVWMLTISMIAQIFGRSYDMPTSMGLALLCMLLVEPVRILDTGMQLSYMAIAGVSFGKSLLRGFHRNQKFRRFEKKHKFRFAIVQSLIYSCSLNLMMTPVLAKSYYMIPTYAWMINLIAVPLMTLVVASGWLGVALSFLSLEAGVAFAFPGRVILQGYALACTCTLNLPGNVICTGRIGWQQMLIWYAGIAGVWWLTRNPVRNHIRDWIYKHTGYFWGHTQITRYVVSCLLAGIGVESVAQGVLWQLQQTEEVCFLDVGQGDGILIRTAGGSHMVIDGGSTSQAQTGTYVLLPALKSQGMTRVDYWFVTHTDEDHISGLEEILDAGALAQIRIQTVVFSKYVVKDEAYYELETKIQKAGITLYQMDVGDVIADETCRITCVYPDASFRPADKNAASLALTYHSNRMNLLFTGDMDADAVGHMWTEKSGDFGSFDCVKLPHHGSKYSYDEKLYADTKYGLVSCGLNNRYGHPHAEVLAGMEQAGTRVLRTDTLGAVIFRGH